MAIPDLQEALDLIEAGRAEDVLAPLTAWAQRMPARAAVHVVLGRAYEALMRWDEAQAAWQQAHFLMPNSPAVAEGLKRIRAAMAEPVAAGDDRLIMDLDLQAELEATLEALFNPFTLPQQSEAALGEPMSEAEAALAQVQAALAAAQADTAEEELVEETEKTEAPTEIEAEAPAQPAEPDTTTEDLLGADPASIYDEIEQLIEEKEARKDTAAEPPKEEPPPAPVAEQPQAEPFDLAAAAQETADEDDVGLEDWQDFDAEPKEAPASDDATIDDLDRLISELEAARIVPQPDLEDIPPPELEDEIDDVVSETLARIYASQKKYEEAARVYEQLAHQHPKEATKFLQLAAEMRGLAGDANDEG